MQLVDLKLVNFRNYDSINLKFSKNNIIYGKNGMGKTNLIEAIYVLALTKSFRSNNEKILLKDNSDYTKIVGTVKDEINNNYQINITKSGKLVKVDNNNYKKISDYISKIKIVLFNPNDLQIIKDSPSIRRKLLNVSISQFDNQYLKYLSNYNKILKQRNSYLKTLYINSNMSKDYLDVLTDQLIDLGLKIHDYRVNYIKNINKYITKIYEDICNIKDISVEYISDYNELDIDKIKKKYKENQEKDMLFGITRFGVHHDDIYFKFKNKDLKEYGSEGQQKNAIIAYKLAEISVFKDNIGKLPILILDDLFSELDVEKINNILSIIDDDIQTFITTTEIDKINNSIIKNSKVFHVTDGKVEEV